MFSFGVSRPAVCSNLSNLTCPARELRAMDALKLIEQHRTKPYKQKVEAIYIADKLDEPYIEQMRRLTGASFAVSWINRPYMHTGAVLQDPKIAPDSFSLGKRSFQLHSIVISEPLVGTFAAFNFKQRTAFGNRNLMRRARMAGFKIAISEESFAEAANYREHLPDCKAEIPGKFLKTELTSMKSGETLPFIIKDVDLDKLSLLVKSHLKSPPFEKVVAVYHTGTVRPNKQILTSEAVRAFAPTEVHDAISNIDKVSSWWPGSTDYYHAFALYNPSFLAPAIQVGSSSFPLVGAGVFSGGLTRMFACLYTGCAAVSAESVKSAKALGFTCRVMHKNS